MATSPRSKAQAVGTGAVISIGSLTGTTGSTGTETFTVIGEVSDGKFSGRKRSTTSVTNFDSAGIARKLDTIVDYGQMTMTVTRVSNDPGQLAVIVANAAGGAYDFTVQLEPNVLAGQVAKGDLITFSGIVTDAGDFDLSLTKQADFSFSIDIDGPYTVTAGS
jgi:hypothetical protein